MTTGSAKFIGATVLMVGLIGFSAWLGVSVWDECREAGHSVLYCMRMVTR